MELLLHFWCLENLPVSHIERLITSKFIVNSPLLVLLVASFPTKLVSSHSEFPCKSYLVFGLSISAPGPAKPGSRPDHPAAEPPDCYSEPPFGGSPNPPGGPPDTRREVWSRRTYRRTVRPRGQRRRTYRRTGRWAASNGHIFPTYKYPSSSLNH
jgi:hypothetical protein